MPLRLSGAAAPFSCNMDYGSLDPRPDDANGDNLEALKDGKQHSQALLEQSDFSVSKTVLDRLLALDELFRRQQAAVRQISDDDVQRQPPTESENSERFTLAECLKSSGFCSDSRSTRRH